MNKILNIKDAVSKSAAIRKNGKTVVLAGGCFDILHIGHVTYLENAKNQGDILFVFVESDETIKRTKGTNRPINNQVDRAKILSSLEVVDYVIISPEFKKNEDYDNLVTSLKPAIIAITKGDAGRKDKKRQAGLISAKVIEVTAQITNQSTTKLIELVGI